MVDLEKIEYQNKKILLLDWFYDKIRFAASKTVAIMQYKNLNIIVYSTIFFS